LDLWRDGWLICINLPICDRRVFDGQEIAMNYVRTAVLLAALTALLMGIGYLLGGRGGALIAFFVAAATNFFAYWNGDRLVLSMHGAQEPGGRRAHGP
jgi:Zn-dependent protease with chaperone function